MQRNQPRLGTYVIITTFGSPRPEALRAMDEAFAAVDRVDAGMSLHRPGSELNRLNESAQERWRDLSEPLAEVVHQALQVAAESGGAFDPTLRPLVELYGFLWKQGFRMPTEEERAAALRQVGWERVELDRANRRIRLHGQARLDLGGLAKGFAVDQAVEALKSAGIRSALVRAGGDLRVLGSPPERPFWRVQLEDPEKRGRRTAWHLAGGAVSTAGNYENFFEHQGVRYSHLLDPRTGLPVQGIASCSLHAPRCIESDAWSTACFVLGPKEALPRVGGRYGLRWVMSPGMGPPRELRNALFPPPAEG